MPRETRIVISLGPEETTLIPYQVAMHLEWMRLDFEGNMLVQALSDPSWLSLEGYKNGSAVDCCLDPNCDAYRRLQAILRRAVRVDLRLTPREKENGNDRFTAELTVNIFTKNAVHPRGFTMKVNADEEMAVVTRQRTT